MNTTNLRDIAQRAVFAMSTEELVKTGALSRLKRAGLHGISPNQLTGYRVNHLLPAAADATETPEPVKVEEDTPPDKKVDNVEFT